MTVQMTMGTCCHNVVSECPETHQQLIAVCFFMTINIVLIVQNDYFITD